MKPEHHPNIPAELADVRPFGDFVLVRREPDHGENIIIDPNWKKNPAQGIKRGTVMSCGPGDPSRLWQCKRCDYCLGVSTVKAPKPCPRCNSKTDWKYIGRARHPMHVEPGDEVLYSRAPANDVVIGDREYVFLHEEQHILAVVEAA